MIDRQLIAICILTMGINLIGTLAYSSRIAGVRTNRIALSFALFNVLVLVSRTSNGFLGPFLAKRVETRLSENAGQTLVWDFQVIMASASLAVFIGIFLIPTGQRIFAKSISRFQVHKSIMRLIIDGCSRSGIKAVHNSIVLPSLNNLKFSGVKSRVSKSIFISNMLAQSFLSVGVISSIYAGYLMPEYRVTASQLSSIINGFATIILFTFIDPQLSQLTDEAVHGQVSEAVFRKTMVMISISRLMGTIFAQLLFLPSSHLIALVSNYI